MKRMNLLVGICLAVALQVGAWAPRLALQTYTFRDRSFAETVETAHRLGFAWLEAYPGQKLGGGLEGTMRHTLSPEARQTLKNQLAAAGIRLVVYGVVNVSGESEWRALFGFANDMGIETIQTETGKTAAELDLIGRLAAEYRVKVALHNHTQPLGRPDAVLEQVKGRGPWIGAGSDIGHWVRAGIVPTDGIATLVGQFTAMHLVDVSAFGSTGRVVPYGSGVGRLTEVLDALRQQQFDGVLTCEYERQSPALESEVAACVRWYAAYCAGELTPDGRLAIDGLSALAADVSASPR